MAVSLVCGRNKKKEGLGSPFFCLDGKNYFVAEGAPAQQPMVAATLLMSFPLARIVIFLICPPVVEKLLLARQNGLCFNAITGTTENSIKT